MPTFGQQGTEQAAHGAGTHDRDLHVFSPVRIEY
jgi:hypothetical protein